MDALAVLLGVLGIAIVFLMAVCAAIDTATRRRRFPNWFEATRTFPAPCNAHAATGWNLSFCRDRPGGMLRDIRIAVVSGGLLVRDLSPFLFPRPRTMMIPWGFLSNPKELTIPRYFLRLRRHAIELQVGDTQFTVVLTEDVWASVQQELHFLRRRP